LRFLSFADFHQLEFQVLWYYSLFYDPFFFSTKPHLLCCPDHAFSHMLKHAPLIAPPCALHLRLSLKEKRLKLVRLSQANFFIIPRRSYSVKHFLKFIFKFSQALD